MDGWWARAGVPGLSKGCSPLSTEGSSTALDAEHLGLALSELVGLTWYFTAERCASKNPSWSKLKCSLSETLFPSYGQSYNTGLFQWNRYWGPAILTSAPLPAFICCVSWVRPCVTQNCLYPIARRITAPGVLSKTKKEICVGILCGLVKCNLVIN